MTEQIKLDIGAGNTRIDGFTPIDRKLGSEAFPLDYADNSVDVIRCSHMLEHLSFQDAQRALLDWYRVLKPGGMLCIAVPDVDRVLASDKPERLFWLMGGQNDDNDFHRSAWDRKTLQKHMGHVGFENFREWQDKVGDTASHECSLRLCGVKPEPVSANSAEANIKIAAVVPTARYWVTACRPVQEKALRPFGIPLLTANGVFWGPCMQRAYEDLERDGVDWILSIDGDSMFTAKHVNDLIDRFGQRGDIDALAALQMRRGADFPLLTQGQDREMEITGEPVKVTTAHFGLTLIRVDALRKLAKPWFMCKPADDGTWGEGRLDSDIWFWHQWRLAGNNIYVDPVVSIGHMQEMVSYFDPADDYKAKHMPESDWRKRENV